MITLKKVVVPEISIHREYHIKSLGISHDYAHCEGKDCKIRETCVRYLLSVESKQMGLTYVSYLVPHFKGNRCMDYWKVREEQK